MKEQRNTEEIHKDTCGKIIQKKFFYRNGNGLLLKQIVTVYVDHIAKRDVITEWKYDCKDRLLECIEAE